MKKFISLCLAILMLLTMFQMAVFAETEEYDPDDRYPCLGTLPIDLSCTNYLISRILDKIGGEHEEGFDPIACWEEFIAPYSSSDDDFIEKTKEMFFALVEGDDPRNWIVIGDIDADDKITAEDARKALCMAVGLSDYLKEDIVSFIAADVDKDNEITASDARTILRAAVGLEEL